MTADDRASSILAQVRTIMDANKDVHVTVILGVPDGPGKPLQGSMLTTHRVRDMPSLMRAFATMIESGAFDAEEAPHAH